MSKVKIEGNASGTGTLTISAPNTNTDRTLTLPDGAGEILTNASTITYSQVTENIPVFMAYNSSTQTISSWTQTKLNFDSEDSDPDGLWNTSTSTFTAPVDGIYSFHFGYRRNSGYATGSAYLERIQFRVNGTTVRRLEEIIGMNQTSNWAVQQCMDWNWKLSANDEVTLYQYSEEPGTVEVGYGDRRYCNEFSGYLVRKL